MSPASGSDVLPLIQAKGSMDATRAAWMPQGSVRLLFLQWQYKLVLGKKKKIKGNPNRSAIVPLIAKCHFKVKDILGEIRQRKESGPSSDPEEQQELPTLNLCLLWGQQFHAAAIVPPACTHAEDWSTRRAAVLRTRASQAPFLQELSAGKKPGRAMPA